MDQPFHYEQIEAWIVCGRQVPPLITWQWDCAHSETNVCWHVNIAEYKQGMHDPSSHKKSFDSLQLQSCYLLITVVEVNSHIPSVTLVSPALLMTKGVPDRNSSSTFLVSTFSQKLHPCQDRIGPNDAKHRLTCLLRTRRGAVSWHQGLPGFHYTIRATESRKRHARLLSLKWRCDDSVLVCGSS